MKTLHRIVLCTTAVFGLLAAGCATTDTVDKRIQAKSDLYAGLTGQEQKQIRAGVIAIGFSPDMVFMALGKPERIIPGSGPGVEDWIYHNYYGPIASSVQIPIRLRTQISDPKSSDGPTFVGGRTPLTKDGYNNKFTVEYDTELENINVKDESALKIMIKFTEGTVADIQILNNGTGVEKRLVAISS